jgi:hypothetical protein
LFVCLFLFLSLSLSSLSLSIFLSQTRTHTRFPLLSFFLSLNFELLIIHLIPTTNCSKYYNPRSFCRFGRQKSVEESLKEKGRSSLLLSGREPKVCHGVLLSERTGNGGVVL